MRYTQPKIEDEGLPKFLERTAEKHNGERYKDLEKYLNMHLSIEKIRETFGGVHRRTLLNWISKDEKLSTIYAEHYKKTPNVAK